MRFLVKLSWCASALFVLAVPHRGTAGTGPLVLDLALVSYTWIGSTSSEQRLGHGPGKAPADPARRFAAFTAKKSEAGYGYVPFARALWAPFRFEATAGTPDAGRVEGIGTGSFGIELVTDDDSFVAFALHAERSQGGLRVEASSDDVALLGARQFAGATAVDLAIAHDGTTLRFLAREEGEGEFIELATVAFTQTTAFFPVLSVYAVSKPALIGFDGFRTSSDEAPGTLSDTARGIERIYDAFDVQLDALHDLDGPQSQSAAMLLALNGSVDRLGEAEALLPKSAAKKVKAAIAKTKAAIKAIEKGKPTETAVKALRKALDLELAARNKAAG
jgi:hypothetical protein